MEHLHILLAEDDEDVALIIDDDRVYQLTIFYDYLHIDITSIVA